MPSPFASNGVAATITEGGQEIVGLDYNTILPGRPRPALPDVDARTHALRAFRTFLSTLEFRRTGAAGQTIPFKVAEANIHIEQPDNVEGLAYPSMVVIPARATYLAYGLGPPRIVDQSLNLFSPGTAVVYAKQYEETFLLEVWAAKIAERRAIVAGIEVAMQTVDDSYALRFRLPEYFSTECEFWLEQRENIEDAETARNRRRAHLFIWMSVPVLHLVNAKLLQHFVDVRLDDEGGVD